MIYGYVCASMLQQGKDGNELIKQRGALLAAGAKTIYQETSTGKKGKKPELEKLLTRLQEGDTLVICKLEQIACSVFQGIERVEGLLKRNVFVHILNIGLMDHSICGESMRNVFHALSDLNNSVIVNKTTEGKMAARKQEGFKEGRPKKYSVEEMEKAMKLLETHSYKMVAEITGISKSTLIRYVKEHDKNE